MSYSKQTFKDGQVLKAQHLNHIESGILAIDTKLDGIEQNNTDIQTEQDQHEEVQADLQTQITQEISDRQALSAAVDAKAFAILCDAESQVIAISDAAAANAISVVSTITAEQEGDGDPSPDNIRPITPVQAVSLTRTGTNLLDIANCTIARNWLESSNSVALTCTSTGIIMKTNVDCENSWRRCYVYIGTRKELAGQTITVTGDYTSSVVDDSCVANMALGTSNTLGGYISSDFEVFTHTPKQNTTTGVVPETGHEYVYASLYLGYGYTAPAGSTVEWSNVRVNAGDKDLGYEPYVGQTLTADLPEAVYGGALDWATGMLTVTHKSVLLDGKGASETGVGTGVWNTGSRNYYVEVVDMAIGIPPLSDCHAYVKKAGTQMALGEMTLGSVNAGIQRVCFGNPDNAISIDEWCTMRDEQPIQMVYTLKEPYTIQLTPQQLTMLKGKNVLFSDSGTTAITYAADTKLYIDNALVAIAASVINQ